MCSLGCSGALASLFINNKMHSIIHYEYKYVMATKVGVLMMPVGPYGPPGYATK